VVDRPLGRGFLAGRYKSPDDLKEGDPRKMQPRFQGESFYLNLKVVDAVVSALLSRQAK
jgi:pyridoxine 4-dehydrogenase